MLSDSCKSVRSKGVRDLEWAARGCEAEAATMVASLLDHADPNQTHVLLQALCAISDGSCGSALGHVVAALACRCLPVPCST
jgi:hypothetical protein